MQVYRDVTNVTEVFCRFSMTTLGNSKSKHFWQTLTVGLSMELVLKSFINNLLMTKSSERKSDIFIGHTSRLYKSTSKHLYLTIMQEDLRPLICGNNDTACSWKTVRSSCIRRLQVRLALTWRLTCRLMRTMDMTSPTGENENRLINQSTDDVRSVSTLPLKMSYGDASLGQNGAK